nr:C40 family peptidase [Paeniglutamicibacter kerguelensis]
MNAAGSLGLAQSGSGTILSGGTASADFTQLLEEALDPARTAVTETKRVAGDATGSPRLDVGKSAVNEVDDAAKAGDGKTDGADVVRESRKYLGVPYVWGGNNPDIGLDCSSFVQHTFRDLGIQLPRVARDQAKEGTEVPSLAQAKPGDLIVTRGGGHIGIYLGDNKMIHAPRPGETVSIRKLFETDAQIMTIRRIVPSESTNQAATKTVADSSVRNSAAQAAGFTASAQRAAFASAVRGA